LYRKSGQPLMGSRDPQIAIEQCGDDRGTIAAGTLCPLRVRFRHGRRAAQYLVKNEP